jgi:hypothetical protein
LQQPKMELGAGEHAASAARCAGGDYMGSQLKVTVFCCCPRRDDAASGEMPLAVRQDLDRA